MPHRKILQPCTLPDEPMTVSMVADGEEDMCQHVFQDCPSIKCGRKKHTGLCFRIKTNPTYSAVYWEVK